MVTLFPVTLYIETMNNLSIAILRIVPIPQLRSNIEYIGLKMFRNVY